MQRRFTVGSGPEISKLSALLPARAHALAAEDQQKSIPAIAKDPELTRQIEETVQQLRTEHWLMLGDGRELEQVADESVHLALTSPPYWTLKKYPGAKGQMGDIEDYDEFLDELDRVWRHVYRTLVPGGRLIVVVGDVCLSRRQFGRHVVFPLHASIQERCRKLGYDNLGPIIWHKIANAQFEVENGSAGFLGKPYEPNGVIKNDVEYILFQRKPGGYRKPSLTERIASVIPEAAHREWFQQIWTITGASTRNHPAPYPLKLAERLVRMYSFVGDTVLDPFMGTATTNLSAALWGRNSIGIDVEPGYFVLSCKRMEQAAQRPQQLSFAAGR